MLPSSLGTPAGCGEVGAGDAVHVLGGDVTFEDVLEVRRHRAVHVEEVGHVDNVVDDLPAVGSHQRGVPMPVGPSSLFPRCAESPRRPGRIALRIVPDEQQAVLLHGQPGRRPGCLGHSAAVRDRLCSARRAPSASRGTGRRSRHPDRALRQIAAHVPVSRPARSAGRRHHGTPPASGRTRYGCAAFHRRGRGSARGCQPRANRAGTAPVSIWRTSSGSESAPTSVDRFLPSLALTGRDINAESIKSPPGDQPPEPGEHIPRFRRDGRCHRRRFRRRHLQRLRRPRGSCRWVEAPTSSAAPPHLRRWRVVPCNPVLRRAAATTPSRPLNYFHAVVGDRTTGPAGHLPRRGGADLIEYLEADDNPRSRCCRGRTTSARPGACTDGMRHIVAVPIRDEKPVPTPTRCAARSTTTGLAPRRRPSCSAAALIGRFLAALSGFEAAKLYRNAELVDLITDGGQVEARWCAGTGVRYVSARSVSAAAAGGFEHNTALRQAYGVPGEANDSMGCPANFRCGPAGGAAGRCGRGP